MSAQPDHLYDDGDYLPLDYFGPNLEALELVESMARHPTANRAHRRAKQGRNPNDGRDDAIARGRRTYRQPGTDRNARIIPGRNVGGHAR